MAKGADEQDFAVKLVYLPLFHYNPSKPQGKRFMYHENGFKTIKAKDLDLVKAFLATEEAKVVRWQRLHTLKGL